ncbi:AsmA family protein [Amorphus orientalis]|uniref:AsmA protein n=1 Tax=Amorphus orientalis TaxID=649198 RepID=A0AAE3VKU0_9HYPH|nr:AsmA family protein [Amorphus orientalis]MDQ0313999.1 AsmA protein [Amorphus orientalis]
MKRVLIALATLCVIVVGTLAALPLFISTQWVRDTVVGQLSRATGLAIAIDGDVGLRAFPTVGLSAESVRVRAPDGADVMSLDTLRADLGLLPLLSGNIRVNEIVLDGLRLALIRQEDGTITLPGLRAASASAADGAAETTGSDGLRDVVAILERLSVGRFDIRNGVVVVEDVGTGLRETVDQLALRLRLPDIDATAHAEGSLRFRDRPLSFTADIETPRSLTSTAPTAVSLAIEEGPMTADLDGTAILADTVSFDGRIAFASDDLSDAVAWASGSAPGVDIGSVSVEATAVMTPLALALTDIGGQIGGSVITGEITLPTATEIPQIRGTLAADTIDLAEFLPQTTADDAAPAAPDDGSLDLSGLNAVDVDLSVTVGELATPQATLRDARARILLQAGDLSIDVPSAGLDGGTLALSIRARDDAGTAAVDGRFRAADVPLATLLAVAPQPYEASGTATANVGFEGRGTTVDALLDAANVTGTVGLRDARVTGLPLADAVPGDSAAGTLEAINLDAEFAGTTGPVSLAGGVTWRGTPFRVDGSMGAPGTLLSGAPTDFRVGLASDRVSASYSGTVTLAGDLSGRIGLATPSLRTLLAWLDRPVGSGDGLAAASIEGVLTAGASSVSLSEAVVSLDASSARGGVSVALAGERPVINADLAFGRLDLTPYVSGQSTAADAPPASDEGWSREPLDLASLRAVDASLSLTAETITIDALKTGAATLGVTLENGTLDALLSQFELYSGSGTGRVQISDRSGATASAEFALDGVDVHRLLKDGADFGALAGTGRIALNVAGSGDSAYALIRAMDGSASFQIANGAILGVNIPRLVRRLSTSVLTGWQSDPAEKTDFTAFGSSFAISDGVATTDDLSLIGPLVRMSGEGSADLADKTLDFRVDPRVVASLEGQGSEADLKGLGVPIVINGPWSDPRIYPDIRGILQNPQAALEQLKSVSGQFEDLADLGATGALVGQVASGDTGGALSNLITQQLGQIGGGGGSGGGDLQNALSSIARQQLAGGRDSGNAGADGSGSADDLIGSAIGQLAGGLAGQQQAPPQQVQTTEVAPAEAPAESQPIAPQAPSPPPDTAQVVSGVIGSLTGQQQQGQQQPRPEQVVGGLVGGLLGQAAPTDPSAQAAASLLSGVFGARPAQQPAQQPAPQAVQQPAPQQAQPVQAVPVTVVPRPNPRR